MTLREYVDKHQLNISQFAKEIGVHRGTLHRYLRGETMPFRKIILQIARATGSAVTADDLVKFYLANSSNHKHKTPLDKL